MASLNWARGLLSLSPSQIYARNNHLRNYTCFLSAPDINDALLPREFSVCRKLNWSCQAEAQSDSQCVNTVNLKWWCRGKTEEQSSMLTTLSCESFKHFYRWKKFLKSCLQEGSLGTFYSFIFYLFLYKWKLLIGSTTEEVQLGFE